MKRALTTVMAWMLIASSGFFVTAATADEWEERIREGWEARRARYLRSDGRSMAAQRPQLVEDLNKPPQVITELKTYYRDTPLAEGGEASSLIIHAEGSGYAGLARELAVAIREAIGAEVPVKRARDYSENDREVNLICLGRMGNNALAFDLYVWRFIASDDWFPGPVGYELRTVSDPWGNGRNVIMLGGSDVEGVRLAADRFVEVLGRGEDPVFPYTIETAFDGIEHLDEFIKKDVERLLGIVEGNSWVIEPVWLIQCAQMYFLTGRREYVDTYVKLLRYWLHDYYRIWSFRQRAWTKYMMRNIIRTFDLIEQSPDIPDDLKLEVTNVFHDYSTRLARSSSLAAMGVAGQLQVGAHHESHKPVVYGEDYFRRYYPDVDREAIELGLEKVRVGYETISIAEGYLERHKGYTPYYAFASMRTGLALGDHAYFTGGAARGWMHYIMLMTDSTGLPMPGRGGRRIESFPIAAGYYRDPEYLGYLQWVTGRSEFHPKMTPDGFSRNLWSFTPRIEPREPSGIVGLSVAPLHKVNYLQIGSEHIRCRAHYESSGGRAGIDRAKNVNIPPERAFQVLTMREGLEAGDQFIQIGGINDGIMARGGDGGAVLHRMHPDSIPEHHNTALIDRRDADGGKWPALADLQLASMAGNSAFVRTVMHDYNGMDWARSIAWIPGRYWVFFDQFKAREEGRYDVRTQWSLARRGALPPRDDLNRFRYHNRIIQFAGDGEAELGQESHRTGTYGYLQEAFEADFDAGQQHVFAHLLYDSDNDDPPYAISRVSEGRVMVSEPRRQVLVGVAPLEDVEDPLSVPEEMMEVAGGVSARCIMYATAPDGLSFTALTALAAGGDARIESDMPLDVVVDLETGTVRARADAPALIRVSGLTPPGGEAEFVLDAWRMEEIATFEPGADSPFGGVDCMRAALAGLCPPPEAITALPPVDRDLSGPAFEGGRVNAGFATALHRASHMGCAESVRRLLDRGADAEAVDHRGRTALHLAAMMGQAEVIAALSDGGANLDARMGDGNTALHLAVYLASPLDGGATVEILLGAGADADAASANGSRPLHLAAAKGLRDVAGMLLDAGADVDAVDGSDRTPLFRSLFSPDSGACEALLEGGAMVDRRREDGTQAIHWAAGRNLEDVLESLVAAGADIESRDGLGRTPLHWAGALAADGSASFLLGRGAVADARDASGRTALERARDVRRVWTFGDIRLDPADTIEVLEAASEAR